MGDTAFREFEEGHLLLVPVLDLLGSERQPAPRIRRVHPPQRTPQADVATLVVALSGLGADVAEHHVHLPGQWRCHSFAHDRVQEDHPGGGQDGEAGCHGQGVAVAVDERNHGVGVSPLEGLQQLGRPAGGFDRGVAHRTASARSNTCGG